MTIYVGNLSYDATEEDLREVFSEYGAVKRITLPMDRDVVPNRIRGFAFVDLETDQDEEKAIAELDGAEWMGRQIRANKARPKEPRSGGGGRF